MKTTLRKIVLALALVLTVTAVLSVAVAATENEPLTPQTVTPSTMDQTANIEKSNYKDIDGNPAWQQVATPVSSAVRAYQKVDCYWGFNHYAYYNDRTKTLVIIPYWENSVVSGRDDAKQSGWYALGEEKVTNVEGVNPNYYGSDGSNNKYYVYCFSAWLDQYGAEVKHLEFRPKTSGTKNYTIGEAFGTSVAKYLTGVETVKYTTAYTFRARSISATEYNTTLADKPELTTVQYGEFATDGTFTTECPNNTVTLAESVQTGDRFGISNVTLRGCSSVVSVVLEENTTGYIGLKDGVFKNCTSLKYLHIKKTITDEYLVGSNVFSGCNGVNVYVNDTSAATKLNGITGVTVKAHTDYENDILDFYTENVLSALGVVVKIKDNNTTGSNVAIRFLFKWDSSTTTLFTAKPVKVGVIACAENYYNTLTGADENAKLVELLGDNSTRVVKSDVATYSNGEMTLVGKFLSEYSNADAGIYGYSYTLYGIPNAHYDDEIYAATYIQWDDGTYTVASYKYEDYTKTEKNTMSLYDATLGLFKQGLINSEKVGPTYLWNVLTIKSAVAKTVTTSSLNQTFYYLNDNILGGYVVAYKAINIYADDGVTLKGAWIGGTGSSGSALAPAHSDFYVSTHTIVADYGVIGCEGARVFNNWISGTYPSVKTVVYPSGFDIVRKDGALSTHTFAKLDGLQDVIWCHTDDFGNYIMKGMDVVWDSKVTDRSHLADLRGLISLNEKGKHFEEISDDKTVLTNIIVNPKCEIFDIGDAIVWKAS